MAMDMFDGIKESKGKRKSITVSLDGEMYNLVSQLAELLGAEKALIVRKIINNAKAVIAKRIAFEHKKDDKNAI